MIEGIRSNEFWGVGESNQRDAEALGSKMKLESNIKGILKSWGVACSWGVKLKRC